MAKILLAGLPGKLATEIAKTALSEPGYPDLLPLALTGPGVEEKEVQINGLTIELAHPEDHEGILGCVSRQWDDVVVIDATHPDAVNRNAKLYLYYGLPFVMCTTGGDLEKLRQDIDEKKGLAVVGANMALPIVALMAGVEYMSKKFPGVFAGWELQAEESHQASKSDTSGTAKAMIGFFKKLGMDFEAHQILKIRDPEAQRKMGISPAFIDAHAFHTYTFFSPGRDMELEITHNICGTGPYAKGSLQCAAFLAEQKGRGRTGVFSAVEVLQSG
jgi:4-hydroxy-tetrahydrodipicolinate reductase